jgi:hypothetical protein
MAITYKSQGSGVSTETSGAALSPLCPATVDAGDILIAHVFWEATTTAPSTPSGWQLLSGPHVIETTIARHWVYGKIADGSEDGAAVAFGNPAVTTQRAARIYSFAGRVSGTIGEIVRGFAHLSHATDPAMPTVTTTKAGALAVALVAQNDNNAFGNPTGESGGDWVEAVAEYTVALTPGLSLGIETATPTADPGTISGGTMATTNDPCGVIGFEIKDSNPVPVGTIVIDGVAPTFSASNHQNFSTGVGAVVIDGVAPSVTATNHLNLDIPAGDVVINGVAPSVTISNNQNFTTDVGTVVIEGVAPSFSVSDNQNFTIPVGEVSIEGVSPSVSVTNNVDLIVPVGEIVISGVEPTLSISDHKNLDIGVGEIVIEGISPEVTASDHKNFNIPGGVVIIEGIAPSVSVSNHINLEIPSGEVIIDGVAPGIGGNANLQIGVGQIIVEGIVPTVSVTDHQNFTVPIGDILIEGVAPSVQTSVNLNIPSGLIVINGIAPTFSGDPSEPIVVDSTVWIKFGKFSIMPCDPCAPKFIVSCLTDEPTDNFDFNIYGLANGVYYWRITERSTILTKAFNHVEGTPLSIAVSDVPDGFFTTKRTFLFEILKTASSENPIPFLIGQYVEQLSIDIECNIYPSNTVGEDTTP